MKRNLNVILGYAAEMALGTDIGLFIATQLSVATFVSLAITVVLLIGVIYTN